LRIKSLQISGFKSFVDKTVFSFKPGITGVVGPNGCGKSNVVDAMRWAMGEQSPRRLRGKGMDDVIFAGSEVRAPVSMAEVVLTFDNSDGLAPAAYAEFSEIQVSRRLYRSGESEYLLNKTSVRLRDVLDFFRDTGIGTKGYTIVEQGQIASIVSAKPDERRALREKLRGLSAVERRELRGRMHRYRTLDADEQAELRLRLDQLMELEPPERERFESNAERWRSMSEAERDRRREQLRRLKAMDPEERDRLLDELLERADSPE